MLVLISPIEASRPAWLEVTNSDILGCNAVASKASRAAFLFIKFGSFNTDEWTPDQIKRLRGDLAQQAKERAERSKQED